MLQLLVALKPLLVACRRSQAGSGVILTLTHLSSLGSRTLSHAASSSPALYRQVCPSPRHVCRSLNPAADQIQLFFPEETSQLPSNSVHSKNCLVGRMLPSSETEQPRTFTCCIVLFTIFSVCVSYCFIKRNVSFLRAGTVF